MLKRGIGFLVVLMLLSMSTPLISGTQAQAPMHESVYVNEVLGVHFVSADNLALIEDEVLVNDEYGFALYDQLRGERGLVLRVGMLFNATPDLDKAVTELMARFPTITFPFGASPNTSGAYIASTRVAGNENSPALLMRTV